MPILSSKLRVSLLSATTGRTAMRRWRWLLALLAVAVFCLSLAPALPEALGATWDKLNHAGAFAVLTAVAVCAFPRSRRVQWLLLFGLLCFGGAIELAQSLTNTRNAEWSDLLADMVGIAAGGLVVWLFSRIVDGTTQSR